MEDGRPAASSRPSTTCRPTPGTSPPIARPIMPFAVLLEVALAAVRLAGGLHRLGPDQPGRPLFPQPRRQGRVCTAPVTPDAGTLTTRSSSPRVSQLGRHDHPELRFRDARSAPASVYQGDTNFGFFTRAGPGPAGRHPRRRASTSRPRRSRAEPDASTIPAEPRSPTRRLRMIDRIEALRAGRRAARARASSRAARPSTRRNGSSRPTFIQDPVWPGSLGLESSAATAQGRWPCERWGGGRHTRFRAIALGKPHRWLYRGQVSPSEPRRCTVQAVVTRLRRRTRRLTAADWLPGWTGGSSIR